MSVKGSFLVLLVLFCCADALAKERFAWEMFLPSMTNRCTLDHLVYCRSRENCESRGGYWYDNSCHAQSQVTCGIDHLDLCVSEETCVAAGGYWYDGACHAEPYACNAAHPDLCPTQQECVAAGGYWYEKKCHPEQSPNAVNTVKLAGEWYLLMNNGTPSAFSRTYTLNENTLKENPAESGIFTIEGTDSDQDPVTGGYVPDKDNYAMRVSKTEDNIFYVFDFTSATEVSGCYHVEKVDGSLGPCVPMVGAKL